ncbi:PhzF family phenazine biosynthesis protein [Echria macrotheca]|uniref:PhzF family phenazine biosynthesis protein n=1 Tax=Echria macrotheca TaxID=438768 RepID=A0AAJ0B4T3_9PEZI|nr:PhzF family phenazine biosynthesis protein [Echria macrotheca]
MRSVPFVTVDVFTTSRFAGNPLAVIPDARDLDSAQMQSIATEFGYSESTFVLPPSSPDNTARVRIFTPTAEIPFAGHPNVGTAYVLGRQDEIFGKKAKELGGIIRFEENAGLVEVVLADSERSEVTGARIRAPAPLSVRHDVVPVDLVARCVSIDPAQVKTSPYGPVIASVGLDFAFAELVSLEALGACRPDVSVFREAASTYGAAASGFPLLAQWHSVARARARSKSKSGFFEFIRYIRARMFAPLDDVMEDPATGSASGALAAFLVSQVPEADVEVELTVEQGVEMGRRSIIELKVVKEGGQVTEVYITGQCVMVMQGTVTV